MSTTTRKPIEKKVKVRERHAEISKQFQIWLKRNPKADKARRISTFDAFCDSAILGEELKRLCRPSKT
jgi:hypothetical protein